MLPEAHPVEETKRSDSQEDSKGPREVTETVTKAPENDSDRRVIETLTKV